MKTSLLVVCMGGLLALTLAGAGYIWTRLADVEMSGHGVAAMVIGILVSLALGIGLMRLIYESGRRGYD